MTCFEVIRGKAADSVISHALGDLDQLCETELSTGFRLSVISLVFLCQLLTLAHAAAEELPNNDEDLTRPIARFDLRYQFEDKSGDVDQSEFILRLQQPIQLNREWKFSTRLDFPLVLNDGTSSDNTNGDTRFGTGDLLVQGVLIDTVSSRFAYGFGLRTLFPTASDDQFGSGKYRLIPLVGTRWFLSEISKGSFFQPVVRYDFDVGGDESRNHISQLQMSPTLNIALRDRWFVTLYPSQDIVLNNIGGHRWFVPADFSIGRNITRTAVTSIELSIPMLKQFTLYDFKLEARFSVSF